MAHAYTFATTGDLDAAVPDFRESRTMMDIEELQSRSRGIAGGPFSVEAEALLSEIHNGAPVRLTTSGTDALEVAAILAQIEHGDVVMVPSFGFVTTALAFVRAGAQIRFVDIDQVSLAMDPVDVARKMDSTVRAVVPIHYGGIPADIETLSQVAAGSERVMLIEDNAHGLFGAVEGRPLGTFGALSCVSFHGTKNVSCGEGGAIVINEANLVDRADTVIEKGTDRRKFIKGQIDKYTWRDMGSSFGLGDYLAALLIQQLDQATDIQQRRHAIFDRYMQVLEPKCDELGFRVPVVKDGQLPAYHLFYIVLNDGSRRDDLIDRMKAKGVNASFHYPPLHQSPGGQRWGDGLSADCPISEAVSNSIVRLPLDHRMTNHEVDRIGEVLVSSIAALGVGR